MCRRNALTATLRYQSHTLDQTLNPFCVRDTCGAVGSFNHFQSAINVDRSFQPEPPVLTSCFTVCVKPAHGRQ